MQIKKVLIDTNILAPLEDHGVVPENYSSLLRKLRELGAEIYIHAATRDDFDRDGDSSRKAVSKSKLDKYPIIQKSVRTKVELENAFGPISRANDLSDCEILAALADNAVELLVTEDGGLHRRAQKCGLGDRVYRVLQLLDLLTERYAKLDGTLSFIESKFCYQINRGDPIFGSLAADYPEFSAWWQKCCLQHRECWVVNSESNIAGIVVYKDETVAEGHSIFGPRKVLKICTFKVSENFRGGRLGEQLIKQAIWYGRSNDFEIIYLTAYEKQSSLIELLGYYGFQEHSRLDGQLVLAKDFAANLQSSNEYEWHRINYPNLKNPPLSVAIVPIRPQFHRRLLPEVTKFASETTIDMFEGKWSGANKDVFIPSTAIRKVYVCKAPLKQLAPGTRLYFYLTKSEEFDGSQSLTGVGILENYVEIASLTELVAATSKRSVYEYRELEEIFRRPGATRVLNFIFCGLCVPQMHLSELVSAGVLKGAPQSITVMTSDAANRLTSRVKIAAVVLN